LWTLRGRWFVVVKVFGVKGEVGVTGSAGRKGKKTGAPWHNDLEENKHSDARR
jgi:hypothetical protein